MQKRFCLYLFLCISLIVAGVIGIIISSLHYHNDYDCTKNDNCTYSLRYDDLEHKNNCVVSLPGHECWTWALSDGSCPNTTICYVIWNGCPFQELPQDHKNLCWSAVPFICSMISVIWTMTCFIALYHIIHRINTEKHKFIIVRE